MLFRFDGSFDNTLKVHPRLEESELLKFDKNAFRIGVKNETVEKLYTCLFKNDYDGLKALLDSLDIRTNRLVAIESYRNQDAHLFNGSHPLFIAAYFCDERILQLLLDIPNFEVTKDFRGTQFEASALDAAIIANKTKNVEALLLKGARVRDVGMFAECFQAVVCGAQVPGVNITRTDAQLIDSIAVEAAALEGVVVRPNRFNRGLHVDQLPGVDSKYNAFQLAAFLGRVEVLKVLYKHRREQMLADRFGPSNDTLLHIAAGQNKLDAIKWLIENDLFVDAENIYGHKAERNADASEATKQYIRSCKLLSAAKANNRDKVIDCLGPQQIPVNSKFEGETILHAFAKNNNVAALEEMLKSNFMVQSDTQFYTNLANQTPLEVAAEKGNWQAAFILMKYKDKYLNDGINLPLAFNIAREKGNYKVAAVIACFPLYDFAQKHKAATAVICAVTALVVCEALRPGCISSKAKILIPNKVREALLGAVEKMGISR